jgi:hypothetical protein
VWAVLAVSLICGCAGWVRYELPSDTTFAPRQGVQVWKGATPLVLHAVSVSADSLLGVPYHKPPSCDSCRVTMRRSDVDSLRLGNPEGGGIVSWAVPLLIVFALYSTWASGFKD